jgi:hypothetical protein
VCITEDKTGLNSNIKVIDLEQRDNIDGWWYKPMIFNPGLDLEGSILFLDLDVIVFNNVDKLFDYDPSKFCIIKDFYAKRKNKSGMNSSCFKFNHNTNTQVYYDFIKNPEPIIKTMHGDQDWIQTKISENYSYWPEKWIMSFKWEMITNGDLKSKPLYDKDTCIAVFHGEPKPSTTANNWCKENWR